MAATSGVDHGDVLFLIVRHLRARGLAASAMALLRESCVDTTWLCGASREMHLLREWVFAGEFGKARAFLQPLANVLSEREYAAALRVIEAQQNTERLHGERVSPAHGHPGRSRPWNVHEARLQCFEDLVPFFREEIGPDDGEYKYLTMPSEQLVTR
uniref:Uncharacterized protein n=1 Tax=Globisporangium ultimum (strain ATCC 200006 / CBS 805.95 / DAOM BR144) TaxID=431595 RepID=K3W5X3_GLOUD